MPYSQAVGLTSQELRGFGSSQLVQKMTRLCFRDILAVRDRPNSAKRFTKGIWLDFIDRLTSSPTIVCRQTATAIELPHENGFAQVRLRRLRELKRRTFPWASKRFSG